MRKHKYILWLLAAMGSLGLTHVENAHAQVSNRSMAPSPCQIDTVHTYINISDQQSYLWSANNVTYNTSGTYYLNEKTEKEALVHAK